MNGGVGQAYFLATPELHIDTKFKRTEKKWVVEITRGITYGLLSQAEQLLRNSRRSTVLNTTFIESLNATFRQRLASLTRRSLNAAHPLKSHEIDMYLIGCCYNFCFLHHQLSKTKHTNSPWTSAMAVGLTEHSIAWGFHPSNADGQRNLLSPSREFGL